MVILSFVSLNFLFGILSLLFCLPTFLAAFWMYKWLINDNEVTRKRLVRAMVINTLMSLIIGIWDIIGKILNIFGVNVFASVLYTIVCAIIYFYYLAITMKYHRSNSN